MQEKCIKHCVPLYQVFDDLTKAFDIIKRDVLCHFSQIGSVLECSENCTEIWKADTLSEPFLIDNGVKQGDIPAPTLFIIYFAVNFGEDFQNFIFVSGQMGRFFIWDNSMLI